MSTALGVAIGVVGKGVASLGLVLQKRSHQRNVDGRHFCTDLRWIAAFITYFAGNMIVIVSLVMAPQVIIAALDSLVLVFNAILAPQLLHGEHLTVIDGISSLIIISGVSVVVYYGPATDEDYTDDQLISLLKATPFIIFASLCVALCSVLYGARKCGERSAGKAYLLDDRTIAGSGAAVAAGTVPAVLSSFNLQLSKICGELVATTIRGDNQFVHWEVYMFLGLLAGCNTLQVISLQDALADYDALLIIPVFQVQLTIFAIINGGIYFKEFASYHTPLPAVLFAAGVLLCIIGIVVLSARKWSTDRHHPSALTPTSSVTPSHLELSLARSISFGLLDPTAGSTTAFLAADSKHLAGSFRGCEEKDLNDNKL